MLARAGGVFVLSQDHCMLTVYGELLYSRMVLVLLTVYKMLHYHICVKVVLECF